MQHTQIVLEILRNTVEKLEQERDFALQDAQYAFGINRIDSEQAAQMAQTAIEVVMCEFGPTKMDTATKIQTCEVLR